jgi:polyketide synthase 12
MDGLAERAGLGKGTVFRRFGSRAGIFHALLDDDEKDFQQRVLAGPPPLGPGADPIERLIAYGRARIDFLLDRAVMARAALDAARPIPVGAANITRSHIRVLLTQSSIDVPDIDSISVQLTAALEGPVLLYLHMPEDTGTTDAMTALGDSWQDLIMRICRPLVPVEGDHP